MKTALRAVLAWPACLGARQGSVRGCLVVLVLACVLPAAGGAVWLLVEAYREGRAALIERAAASSRSLMEVVDSQLQRATSNLRTLATSPALATGDLESFHRQAMAALPYQPGNNVVLTDASGQQRVNTLVQWGAPLPRHGNPAMLRRVIDGGEPVISDVFVGGLTRQPLIAVEVPVTVDGRVAYGLAMGFFPDRFIALLEGQQPDRHWVVAVFDSSGTVVARTHSPERFVGHKGAAALVAAMARTSTGVVQTDTLEGVPVIAVFSKSPSTGWTVAVGVPREMLLAPLERWAVGLAVAIIALLALGIAVASHIARRIAQSINALQQPAEALGTGTGVDVPQLPVREADVVGQAINRASRLLQMRTSERDEATQATMSMRLHAMRLQHEVHHDPLTRLANRSKFLLALNERIASCQAGGGALTVFFVDVDDFKPVNDRYGHLVGDDLLRDFAARLEAGVRSTDLVARLGGDEFAVLLEGLALADAEDIARSLSERLSRPYAVRGHAVHVSACIGAAGFPGDGADAEALLNAADAAMYRAKARGKGGYAVSGLAPLT